MPSRKSKEDTWKESELLDAIQGSDKKKKSSSSKSGKSGESSKHGSKDEKDRHRRSDAGGRREREGDKERERKREPVEGGKTKHRDEGKRSHKDERERSSKKKDEALKTENEEGRSRAKERERSDDRDKERRRNKEELREKEKRDGERKERKDKERESGERKERREREKDRGDRKDRKERERDGGDGRERKREKDDEGSRSRHRDDGELKGKHHKSKKEDRDREDSREGSKHKSSRSSKDGKSSKDRKEKKDRREEEGTRNEIDQSKKEEHRSDRSKDRKDRDGSAIGEDDAFGSSSNKNMFEKKEIAAVAAHGQRFRKASLDQQNSYEEEIEDQSRRKASIARRKSSLLNTDEVNEEVVDGNDYNYEDEDFEDYDDDFEDDDGDDDEELNLTHEELEGVDEIRKAMREENQLAESHNSSQSSSRPSTRDDMQGRLGASSSASAMKAQPRGKINFIAAKQKQISDKVAGKTRRRGKELSKLIELDVVAMDLFELQPLNIYEVYMKSFGRTNTEQVAVQTNEDCLEQETQTEDIETETKWCQFSNEVQSFGGENEKSTNGNASQISKMSHDTGRLNKFLSRATQLCMTLLNEMVDNEDRIVDRYEQSNVKFSERFFRLKFKSQLIDGRPYVDRHTSESNLLLTAYGKSELDTEAISPDGIICVWNLNSSTDAQMYLHCGSTPNCCCFSPRKPSFAFAGMEDGSVSIWDLREQDSLHTRKKLGETEIILRSETFSTASVYGDDAHNSSVVSIAAIAPPEESIDSDSKSTSSEETGGTLQLASLDESGLVNIWVVIEMFSPDPGGSQQDLGLLPGGKVKLVKSGSIGAQLPRRLLDMHQNIALVGTVIHVEPSRGKSLYIGTGQGVVLHSSRFGDKVVPKAFFISEGGTSRTVSCIDHSHWNMPYLLVGCTDGSIVLLNTEKEYPVTTWEAFGKGASVLSVRWLRNKPGIFCSLDQNSVFCVWDLMKSDTSPIFKESLRKSSNSRALDFSLLGDSSDKKQQVVISFEDNTVEIHKLAKSLCGYANEDANEVLTLFNDMS